MGYGYLFTINFKKQLQSDHKITGNTTVEKSLLKHE